MLGHMMRTAAKVANQLGIAEDGFRTVVNNRPKRRSNGSHIYTCIYLVDAYDLASAKTRVPVGRLEDDFRQFLWSPIGPALMIPHDSSGFNDLLILRGSVNVKQPIPGPGRNDYIAVL